jgi:hypothetical protein
MVELIDNPFDPKILKKYTDFFTTQQTAPGFPSKKARQAELKEYKDFLGTTDYTSRLKESEDLAKMQLGLALAQRGFAAMGAQPRRGESAIGVLGRTLAAPLAGDLSTVAGRLMQQRQAAKLAEEQEERQLKISALQSVKQKQASSYSAKVAAESKAREFMLAARKMKAQVSDKYTVDGERVPVIIKTDYEGNTKYYKQDGKTQITSGIGVWEEPKVFKDKVTNLNTIEALVINPKDKSKSWMPIPAQSVTSFDSDGSVVSTVLQDLSGKRLLTTGGMANARKAPKDGSKSSIYYPPKRDSIFLKQSFVDAYGLPRNAVGKKATLEIYTPKPDVADNLKETTGKVTPEKLRVRFGGAVYDIKSHTGYNPVTQSIKTTTSTGQPQQIELSSLWESQDPKSFKKVRSIIVPQEHLESIRLIRGLGGVKSGETLDLLRNPLGQQMVEWGGVKVPIEKDSSIFQFFRTTKEPVPGGLNNWVNTSNKPVAVSGVTIAPGQSGSFTDLAINNAINKNPGLQAALSKGSPRSLDTKLYMFARPTKYDGVDYVPGDVLPLNPVEHRALSDDLRRVLILDPAMKKEARKRDYFKSLWEQVAEDENISSPPAIEEKHLKSLLAMFPAGNRSGGKTLREEVRRLLGGNRPTVPLVFTTYKETVAKRLDAAKTRFDEAVEKGAVKGVWDALNHPQQIAFANIKGDVAFRNLDAAWTKSQENLEKKRKSLKNFSQDDLAKYAAASRMKILTKWLLENKDLEKTGVLTGWLSSVGVNVFGDLSIATSGASKRVQQVITDMRAAYQTLAGTEGRTSGRDPSIFTQRINAKLLPAFRKPEAMNEANLKTIANRLDVVLKAPFSPEIQSTYVIPQNIVEAAKEAGIETAKSDPRRYPWIDPNEAFTPLVKSADVLEAIGRVSWDLTDAIDKKIGTDFPRDAKGNTWRKVSKTEIQRIKNGKLVGLKFLLNDVFKSNPQR